MLTEFKSFPNRASFAQRQLDSDGPCVVRLLKGGLSRIPDSRIGDTYPVHNVHLDITGDQLIVHVRDYSRSDADSGRTYVIWTVGYLGRDCEEVAFKTMEGVRI